MEELTDILEHKRVITLPTDSRITPEMIQSLETLLDNVPPRDLRETLMEIYQQYVLHQHEALPVHFHEMAGQLYLLFAFVNEVERAY